MPLVSPVALVLLAVMAIMAAVFDARAGRVPIILSLLGIAVATVYCWWGTLGGAALGAAILWLTRRRLGGADVVWSAVTGAVSLPGLCLGWAFVFVMRARRGRLLPIASYSSRRIIPVLVAGGALGAIATEIFG